MEELEYRTVVKKWLLYWFFAVAVHIHSIDKNRYYPPNCNRNSLTGLKCEGTLSFMTKNKFYSESSFLF